MASEPMAAYGTQTHHRMTSVMIDYRVAPQVMLYAQFLTQSLDARSAELKKSGELQQMSTLPEDWDGYNAAPVNKQAIYNCQQLLNGIYCSHPLSMEVLPTNAGAVMIRYKVGDTLLRGEIGESMVSYFVRRKGKETEYHNFESWNEDTIQSLRTIIGEI